MQLFVTDPNPSMNAIALDDKRVIKGTLEAAQMLSTVTGRGYRRSHPHHPLTKWAEQTSSNIRWLAAQYLALAAEYSHRTGKHHKSLEVVGDMAIELAGFEASPHFINFAKNKSRGLDFTWCEDVFQAYRMYLRARWHNDLRKPLWTNRAAPDWLDQGTGYGSDGQRLYCRARNQIGYVRISTEGQVDCPACGDTIEWSCYARDNYVELECNTPDCLYFEEKAK